MTYIALGFRGPITGELDTTGQNPGNWTVTFSPDILNVTTAQFEVYKIVVESGSIALVTFDVFVDVAKWDTAVYGNRNSWDPTQPLAMRPGQYLYFFYSDPVTDNTPPIVTIWLRYDPSFGKSENSLWDGSSYSPRFFKRAQP